MRLTTDDVNTYIVMPHSFSAVRVMNDRLSPVMFEIEISLISEPKAAASPEEAGVLAGLGFQKIKTWLELGLHEVIIVGVDSDIFSLLEAETDNSIMLAPSQPDDAMVASLLLTKMQTVAGDLLTIDSITLASSDTGFMKRFMRNIAIRLPGIEYLGVDAAHSKPWWLRETMETTDYEKNEGSEEYFAEITTRDPLKELDKLLLGDAEADVISIDTWKTDKPH